MNSFDREDLHAPAAEINTTPLVDVMLVLMVIFLITAPVLEQAVKLDLPKEAAASLDEVPSTTVSITKDGKYYWNSEQISRSSLEDKLAEIKRKNPNEQLIIRADGAVLYEDIAHVLASASRIGLTNIAFVSSDKD